MRVPARTILHGALAVLLLSLMAAGQARAQDVLVLCAQDQCTYETVHSVTLAGQNSVRLGPAAGDPAASRAAPGRSVRFSTLSGLYREPASGALRVLNLDGGLGDVVILGAPSRQDQVAPAWTLRYAKPPSRRADLTVGPDRFVALIRHRQPSQGVVAFLKQQVRAGNPHPARRHLITAGVAFSSDSEDMRLWQEELRRTIRASLADFRGENVDATLMEATLSEGLAAIEVLQQVASNTPQDEEVQQELRLEARRLKGRFAVAEAFRNAELHDEYIEKLTQIGLARWSRPTLVEGARTSLEASAEAHFQRARELFGAGQFANAFDASRLAASRMECSEEISEFYDRARLEFVNQNLVATVPEYTSEHRNVLQQIVRELQSISQDLTLSPERIDYVRRRVEEGERLDKDYLPLQLRKAEFLANIGELTAAREVVTRVQRTVRLGRAEAEEWLSIDAKLNGRIRTLRQSTQRQLTEQIANGQFKEALETAEGALRAEPTNPRFLYAASVSAAVLRNQQLSRSYAERYFRLMGNTCTDGDEMRTTLFEIYRRPSQDEDSYRPSGKSPNWISGRYFAVGEAYYDPTSGSFNAHLLNSTLVQGKARQVTEFRWEGFLATVIQTTTGLPSVDRRPLLELEPVYDAQRVYMSGIGTRANSAGQRRVQPLRYLNSPDFDPAMAAKFTDKTATRGWAGNPFFHPFIWNDIYLFDLVYDELGRIRQAIPVPPDATRPGSPFSEALTFTWDGPSLRLLSISSARYRRQMSYDSQGRLRSEKITHAAGKGSITYKYKGDAREPNLIESEDNFYDRGKRTILLRPVIYR